MSILTDDACMQVLCSIVHQVRPCALIVEINSVCLTEFRKDMLNDADSLETASNSNLPPG
jgi:hypothetical protein